MRVDARDQQTIVDDFRHKAESVGASVRDGDDATSATLSGEEGSLDDSLDDSLVAVIRARIGIAETGSVLVVHDDPDAVRSMALARRLIVLVERDTILDSLVDAAETLELLGHEHLTWTLLTGPSRTADIERQLTIGVHGSIELEIVIVP